MPRRRRADPRRLGVRGGGRRSGRAGRPARRDPPPGRLLGPMGPSPWGRGLVRTAPDKPSAPSAVAEVRSVAETVCVASEQHGHDLDTVLPVVGDTARRRRREPGHGAPHPPADQRHRPALAPTRQPPRRYVLRGGCASADPSNPRERADPWNGPRRRGTRRPGHAARGGGRVGGRTARPGRGRRAPVRHGPVGCGDPAAARRRLINPEISP
jgi:hypothetical protein